MFTPAFMKDIHPFGVIRQRTRSDQEYPDLGQLIAWDMRWRRTSILVEEQHGGADCHVTRTSQDAAELIIASLARRYWYSQALQVPWVRTAYPAQARDRSVVGGLGRPGQPAPVDQVLKPGLSRGGPGTDGQLLGDEHASMSAPGSAAT